MCLTFPASLSAIFVQAVMGEEGAWEISHQQEAMSVGMGLLKLDEEQRRKRVCVCELAGQDIHLLVKAVHPQPAQSMATVAQPGF